MKTTTNAINATAILNAFNNYNKSFNSAIRFIFDLSKESANKVPASPTKDDKSEEAKQLRKEIKAIEARNAIIADAKRIVETFAITANDIKGKAISALYSKVSARIPNVDETGKAVKFVKLPSYLKNEIKDYATTFQVVPATWIEAICSATDNTEKRREIYVLVIPPVVEDGKLVEMTTGDIVNAKGERLKNGYEAQEIWNKEATIRNIANAVGRAATNKSIEEQKAAK